jgi:hypothetical protein
MRNIHDIANYHTGIYRSHDKENWSELKNNFANFLISLGYAKKSSQDAAKHLLNGYKYADRAFAEQGKKRYSEENNLYNKMLNEFEIAYKTVGADIKPLKYKRIWYKEFRHNNHFKMLWNYFREQFAIFGLMKFYLALHVTYLAYTRIYKAHGAHDWKALNNALIDSWRAVSKSYKTGRLPIEL